MKKLIAIIAVFFTSSMAFGGGSVQTSHATVDSSYAMRAFAAILQRAQGFQVGTTVNSNQIDLYLTKVGSPTGNVWTNYYSDSSGAPNTSLGQSNNVDVTTITANPSFGWHQFDFAADVNLVAATQYHLIYNGDYTISAVNYTSWGIDSAAGYASGTEQYWTGATWTDTADDANFKVYGTVPSSVTSGGVATPAPMMIYRYDHKTKKEQVVAYWPKDRAKKLDVRAAFAELEREGKI